MEIEKLLIAYLEEDDELYEMVVNLKYQVIPNLTISSVVKQNEILKETLYK